MKSISVVLELEIPLASFYQASTKLLQTREKYSQKLLLSCLGGQGKPMYALPCTCIYMHLQWGTITSWHTGTIHPYQDVVTTSKHEGLLGKRDTSLPHGNWMCVCIAHETFLLHLQFSHHLGELNDRSHRKVRL